jgi:predicted nicotinamide N-methyase
MRKLTTPEDVDNLLNASTASAALGTAIETGLLWMLSDQPMDDMSIAQALNIPARRCRYWLQLLQEIGIVEQSTQGYAPSALAREAFLNVYSEANWRYLAGEERERSAGVHNLALYISEPGSIWKAQGLTQSRDYVEKMRADAGRARAFTRMLYDLHQNLANELAARLEMTGVRRVLDVGGGSGVVSMALVRKYPDLNATVVDIENVCIAGREIAAENLLSDRIEYQPVEFDCGDFPIGFDMILLCDVGIFGEPLFRKLRASLNAGGKLIIIWSFPSAEGVAPRSRIALTFLDSLEDPSFALPTIAQTQEQLLHAGFDPLPEEYTLPDGRIVIEAQAT